MSYGEPGQDEEPINEMSDLRLAIQEFEDEEDAVAWNGKEEDDEEEEENKYFCPTTGAHFNFKEAAKMMKQIAMIKPSQRRLNYEYESESEEEELIKDLFDCKDSTPELPEAEKQFLSGSIQQFQRLTEPEEEEEPVTRESARVGGRRREKSIILPERAIKRGKKREGSESKRSFNFNARPIFSNISHNRGKSPSNKKKRQKSGGFPNGKISATYHRPKSSISRIVKKRKQKRKPSSIFVSYIQNETQDQGETR